MFVSVFLDPAFPLPPNAGKRKVMYIVHMVGHYQKGDIAGSPIVTVTTDPPTIQQVTPLMETTDPAMIDLSQVAFEFSSTSPRSRIFVPNTGDTESPEIEILNFKMYPGVVLTAAQIVDSKFLMHLESYPLEPRVQSTFVDTRLVIVRDVAFDFASQIDRTVVGIRSQNEAFAGSFEHFPTSGRGSSSIYTRVTTEVWERDATGFVTTMWFTAHQVSSDLDKVGLSRIRFILVSLCLT